MRAKHAAIALSLVVLSAVSAAWVSIAKPRILIEQDSLKVSAADTFPKDLGCEIHVGSERNPYFRTEGEHGQLKLALIDVNLSTTVSVRRRDTQKQSYYLFLFSEDGEGRVFGLFDLNMDGEWDVKKTPTGDKKNFIRLAGEWFEVDEIEGLSSETPTAVKGGKHYEFRGKWVRE